MCRAGILPTLLEADFSTMNTIAYSNYYYQYYKPQPFPQAAKIKKTRKLARIFGVIGVALFLATYAPYFFYSARMREAVHSNIPTVEAKPDFTPPFNPNLPTENKVKIGAIGVDTPILEAPYERYEDAFRLGVWRFSDFSTPTNRQVPTVLAAHRFGYLKWSNTYRRKNSFYNLPKLKPGDTIEIVWRQRKYVYAIYQIETGAEISDFSADLVLFTCQDLTSDTKVFAYAKLLGI